MKQRQLFFLFPINNILLRLEVYPYVPFYHFLFIYFSFPFSVLNKSHFKSTLVSLPPLTFLPLLLQHSLTRSPRFSGGAWVSTATFSSRDLPTISGDSSFSLRFSHFSLWADTMPFCLRYEFFATFVGSVGKVRFACCSSM